MRKITKTEKKMMKGKRLLKISLMLVAFFAFSLNGKAQTVVTVGGGATVTCPAVPTATWTTPPTGVTFSNWSRGSGVTCGSASTALSGSTFSSTSASAAKTANKFYSVTITADASHSFTLNSVVWNTAISSGSCTFDVQYSNNLGTVTSFGTTGQTGTTTNTFSGSVTVNPSTSIVLYLIPWNATSGSTIRWNNGSTISVTASSLSPCSAPTSAPTALSFSGQTTTAISGSFTAASTAPTGGYLVVQSTASTLSSNPVDGTTYTAGTALGGGTVCAVNNPTTYTFTSNGTLTAGTQYYFYVIPFNKTAGTCSEAYGNSVQLSGNTYTCIGVPTALNTGTITSSTAVLTWTAPSGTVSSYDIQWKTTTGGSFATITGVTSGHTLNPPLSASTSYDVQVRANNSVCTGAWSSTKTFVTSCASATLPYTEGFEGLSTAYTLPACMTSSPTVASGGKCQTYIATSGSNSALVARTGSKYAAVYYNPYPASGYFFSAPLQLTAGVSYNASVYYKTDGTAWTDATIYYGTSATTAAMTNTIATVANAAATSYTQITGAFTPSSTGIYYVAFRGYNATISPNYIAFDDFSVSVAVTPTITLSSNAIIAGNLLQNSTNNPIYSFAIGSTVADASLTGLTVTTNGGYASADITNLKAWYQSASTFNSGTATLLSTLTTPGVAGSKTFPSFVSQAIASGATGYIFITADVPCAATASDVIGINAVTASNTTFALGTPTGTPAAGNNQTVAAATPVNVTSPAASIANATSAISWTAPTCYSEVLIVARSGSANDGTPTGDGSTYTGNLAFGSGTALGSGFVVYKGSTSPAVITGLTNGTIYYYKLFTRSGSVWSSGVEVSATPSLYCTVSGTPSSTRYFSNITTTGGATNNINNTTAYTSVLYNDYTNATTYGSVNQYLGGSFSLTPTIVGLAGTNGSYAIWVDWNQTGTWTNIYSNTTYASSTSVGAPTTINIPSNATLGNTRIRIWWDYNNGTPYACLSSGAGPTAGEIVDYTLTVLAPIPVVSSATSASSTYGTAGSYTIVGTNTPTSYSATAVGGGALPTGFSISSNVVSVAASTPAGSYSITVSAINSYGTGSTTLTYTVNTATLTVAASAQSKTYGTAAPTSGTVITNYTVTGLKNSDAVSGATLGYNGSPAGNLATASVGTYTITPSAVTFSTGISGNYTISYTTGVLTVGAASLTVTASAQSKTYGSTAPTSGTLSTNFTVSGLQNSDAVSGATLGYNGSPTGNLATAAVGTYTITPSAVTFSTGTAGNYSISYTTGILTVNHATLIITASNQSKTYGGTVSTTGSLSSTYTITGDGLKSTDAIAVETLAFNGTPSGDQATAAAGTYNITPSTVSFTSGSASNYTITYFDGTLTVDQAPLSVTASAQSKYYGSASATAGTLGTDFTVSGILNSDAVSGATLSYNGSPTGNLATASVGTYTITPSAITLSTGATANYSITYNTGTLTVDARPLTITANAVSKTEGDVLTSPTTGSTAFTPTGLQNGETIGSVTITYGSSALAATAAGTYTGDATPSVATAGTFTASNYTITYVAGDVTITSASAPQCPLSTTTAPSSTQTLCVGVTAATLTNTITTSGTVGTPTYSYQWYYNTTNSNTVSGATLLSGATNSTYVPQSTSSEVGTRYYFCVGYAADNTCGQTDATQSLASNTVEVTVNAVPAAPTGSASQAFCGATSPTVASLSISGSSIKWYNAATSGTLLSSGDVLSSTSYYATQTVNGCESPTYDVTATVNTTPSAPTSTNQAFCSGLSHTIADLTATGTTIKWYSASTGGSALSSSATLTTATHYYASQTSAAGCESTSRYDITVTVNTTPSVPTGLASQPFCSGTSPKVSDLAVTSGTNINWYNASSGGTLNSPIDALTTTHYYATQTDGTSGCESTSRLDVAVTVNTTPATPTGSASQPFCTSAAHTVANLSASAGSSVLWYTASTGGSALSTGATLTSTHYYAGQTVTGCQSSRLDVTVTINTNPPTPTGTAAQSFCTGASPTVSALAATAVNGGTIQWYNASTGGSPLSTGNALTTATHYYATELNATTGCESVSRFDVTATVNNSPSAITVSPTTTSLCNGSIQQLTASPATLTILDPAGDGGFQNGTTFAANGWTVSNGSATNTWQVSTVPTQFANRSAFISSDGGTTYNYNTGSGSEVYFYRDITFPTGVTNIALTYNWLANGEATWDFLQVAYMPTATTFTVNANISGSVSPITTALISGSTVLSANNLITTGVVQSASATIPNSVAGTTKRLVFIWRNDGSLGANPSAVIDNISITASAPSTWSASSGLWIDAAANTTAYTNGTSATSVYAKPTTSTTYTVTNTNAAGCTATATATVNVTQLATATAGSDISNCGGSGAITMTGASVGGSNSGNTWSGGASLGSWSNNADPALATFTPNYATYPQGSFIATLTTTAVSPCTNATSTRKISWGNIGSWIGVTSTDWNTGTNWCGGAVPTSSTNVIIPSSAEVINQPTIANAASGVCNNITINSGATLTMGTTSTLAVSGNWANNGTFTCSTSTVTFNGTTAISGSTTNTFNNISITGAFTAPAAMNVAGNWANTGTFTHNSGTVTFTSTATGKTLTGTMTGTTGKFNNITFNGSGAWSFLTNSADVAGNFTVTTGAITAPSTTLSIAGNFSNSATFTHNSGTVTFNGTTQSISGSTTTFSTLTIANGSTVTGTTAPTAATFNINGGGKYIHSAATAVVPGTTKNFAATSTYEWRGTGAFPSVAVTFGNLIINSASGNNNASGLLTTVNGNLNIVATTGGSYRIVAATTGITLTIGGNLQIDGGTFNLSVGAGAPALIVNGDVILNGGIFQPYTGAGIPTISVKGNWTNSGGTYTKGASEVVTFNGTTSGGQTIGGTTATTFSGLTLNNSYGLTINTSPTISALTLTSGLITTGTNNVTIASGGTITGASSTTYVNGILNRVFPSATSLVFPVGKGGYYRPVTFQYTALTGTSTVTVEQNESAITGSLPASTNLNNARTWDISQTGGSAFTYKVTLDNTGDVQTGTVVMLKKESGAITSNAATTPNYTNTTGFTTLSGTCNFTLGSTCTVTSNAGTNQTGAATCGLTSVTLAANTPSYGTGAWTIDSGTGGSFGAASSPTSSFSGTAGTAYVLRWTVTNGNCSASSTVNVTFNQNPTASAGGNHTICQTGSYTLTSGEATASVWGTILWSHNGAGSLSGATTLTPTYTAVAGDASHTVTLTMTVSNNPCTAATANYSVIVEGSPTATAGGSQTICQSATATISGASATNGSVLWTHNGAGTISDDNTLSPIYTPASGDVGNIVTLTMTVSSTNSCAPSSATASYTIRVGALNEWLGVVSNDWNTAINWCGGVPTATTNVVIPSYATHMPIISGAAECNHITIASGSTLSMDGTGTLTLTGNWTNNGTFTSAGGMVTFAGSSAQTISGSNTFDNIYVNNASGVSLSNDITVTSILELDNGNVQTGSNKIRMEANAFPIAIGGLIEGNLEEYIPSGFGVSAYYPIGTGTSSAALDLFFDNVLTDGYVTASTTVGDHLQISTSGFNSNQTVNRTWSMSNQGVSFDQYQIGLSYQNSDKDAGFVDSYAAASLYTGSSWQTLPNSYNYGNYQSVSNVSSLGDFQIGVINPTPSLYTISPSLGAQLQTLDVVLKGAGFITNASSLNVGTGITVNTVTVNSDTMLTANISISLGASIGVRPFTVTNGLPGGGTSGSVNFMVTGPFPIANFVASSTTIDCNLDGTVTFNNLTNYATSYSWNFGIGATPSSASGFGPYTVSYSSTGSKTITLIATNVNGNDTLTSNITVNASVPGTPASITGPINLCAYVGQNVVYTSTLVNSATGYSWFVPSGISLVSGQGTSAITVTVNQGFTTGSLSVVATNACGSSISARSISLLVNIPASAPATMTGVTSLCSYLGTGSSVNYTCSTVTNATGYKWTLPSGINLVSGQGTTHIVATVSSGFTTGTLSVLDTNACGASLTAKTLALTATIPATAPASIAGATGLCVALHNGTNVNYTCPTVTNATGYKWTLPSGLTLVSGQGTTHIILTVGSGFTAGTLSVVDTNACGASLTSRTLALSATIPATAPTSITGTTALCSYVGSNTTINYTCPTVTNATGYKWTLPSGLNLVSGQGTTHLVVTVGSSFTSGTLMVADTNVCGSSLATRNVSLNGVPPATAPATLSGQAALCSSIGANEVYTCSSVSGAAGYNWTIPSGLTYISGQGTTSLTVNVDSSFTSGTLSVSATYVCGISAGAKSLALNAVVPASPPASITGLVGLCNSLGSNVVYTCSSVTNATGYDWTIPTGLTTVSGQGTTSLTVHVDSTFVTGNLSVKAINSCGSSAGTTSISIVTAAPALTGSISGPSVVCGLTSASYSATPVAGVSSYSWTVPTGLTITSGQGTPSINVTVAAGTILGTLTLQATNTCGSNSLTTAITKKPIAPSIISGPVSLCGQTTANYTTSSAGATSYTWTLPTGITVSSGTGTSSINANIAATFVAGNINVTAVNACGSTAGTARTVYGKIPAATTAISGLTNVCGVTTTTYTATGVVGAASYAWTLPTGLSSLSTAGSSITVQNAGFTGGSISVQAINVCGTGAAKVLALSVASASPGVISGPTVTCGLTSATYSVAAVTGATGYTWTAPAGATLSGQGTSTIVATFATPMVGTVSVTSHNACANSAARTLAVTKISATPGAITGVSAVCGLGSTTYSIAAIAGATNYVWTLPTGLTIAAGQGTSSIVANVASTAFPAGTIYVNTQNACGSSGRQSKAITVCASPEEMTSETNNNIRLYPNPATSEYSMEIQSAEEKEIIEEVYDVLGNMVRQEKHTITVGENLLRTNIEAYKNGIYMIRIIDHDSSIMYTQRLIKQ